MQLEGRETSRKDRTRGSVWRKDGEDRASVCWLKAARRTEKEHSKQEEEQASGRKRVDEGSILWMHTAGRARSTHQPCAASTLLVPLRQHASLCNRHLVSSCRTNTSCCVLSLPSLVDESLWREADGAVLVVVPCRAESLVLFHLDENLVQTHRAMLLLFAAFLTLLLPLSLSSCCSHPEQDIPIRCLCSSLQTQDMSCFFSTHGLLLLLFLSIQDKSNRNSKTTIILFSSPNASSRAPKPSNRNRTNSPCLLPEQRRG